MAQRWYESPLSDEGVVISSRVRFARNFEGYAFPGRLTDDGARHMNNETARAVLSDKDGEFKFFDITDNSPETLLPLMERHVLSKHMVAQRGVKGVILNPSENLSVLLNEEDHTRIQAIFPGDNIDGAYAAAAALESLIETRGEAMYAFDHEYGFLTSCPTNVGTGMRASFMMHLPALEATGYIVRLLPALGKFGMTMRGIHGEGSASMGCVYQLSNQITLGKPENEIILALKSAASQVIAQEKTTRQKLFAAHEIKAKDRLFRAYGILTNCYSLDHKEGMSLLSDLRLGYAYDIYDMPRPKKTTYALMTEIQPGTIQARAGRPLNQEERDVCRADYIRGELKR